MLSGPHDFKVLNTIVGWVAVDVVNVVAGRDLDTCFIEDETMLGHITILARQRVIGSPHSEITLRMLDPLQPHSHADVRWS